mmetsp:Transcript_31371/g.88400  ORF Transcript_31371/g.88400 Transcript_31371/m.88400 type:complete len:313 (+) Transcript_31371:634-1572(+)
MHAATNSVQWMIPSRSRSRESAISRASRSPVPKRSKTEAIWPLLSWPVPAVSNSWKRFRIDGSWLAGHARAIDSATLLWSTLRWTAVASSWTILGRIAAARSPCPASSGRRKNSIWRQWAAVGRRCRSSWTMLQHALTARSEAWCNRSHGAAGGALQNCCPPSRLEGTMKGRARLRHSKSTTPLLKTSALGVTSPTQTSGAIVAGVPIGFWHRKSPGRKICATPRSMSMTKGFSLMCPSVCPCELLPGGSVLLLGISMMLADFRSMWTMPRAWTCTIAIRTCRITSDTNLSGIADPDSLAALTVFSRSPPEQ